MKGFFKQHCTLSNTATNERRHGWIDGTVVFSVLKRACTLHNVNVNDSCKTQQTSLQRIGSNGKALVPETGCQNNHDMLRTARSFYPTCGGSSTAVEWGTAANALYACLILMGNSLKVSGDGAGGCTEGSNAKESKIKGLEDQTERDRQRDRSNNAWLKSMQRTCVLFLQRGKKCKKTRGRLWKR